MHDLELCHLTKRIGRKTIFSDVSCHFCSGAVHGLIGENGTGKTMLLRTIAGLTRPTQGSVRFDGCPITLQSHPVKIGLVLEHASLFPNWSVWKNLSYLAAMRSKLSREQLVQSICAVGLDPEDPTPYGKLSLGTRQRALLAQATMEEPELLLFDEPTNGIDREGIPLVQRLIEKERERGAVILLSSHIQGDLRALCTQCHLLDKGELCDATK